MLGALSAFVDDYNRAYERAAQQHGLTSAQACVLGRLDRPRRMSELAAAVGCDASNITQIIKRLENRSLVQRRACPEDGRARQVVATADGEATRAAFDASFAFVREMVEPLDGEEQTRLASLLRKAMGAAPSRHGRPH
ncbi:MarR family winged helix-turn-helix transcriptional regulator [Brachybacterium sp. YJGR34]|uniref:MarR family winged helix-turn-helix transcriptional regulator n=1 Tax=Brachybacterium sp. YJGR34 TaxID=2059911 RepID=UPI001E400E9E|nr:MarR family transcriptional regulator [Brachybacterium sp. YJGR34]